MKAIRPEPPAASFLIIPQFSNAAQRIQEAIGYQSCGVVEAINEDLKEAIGAGLLPSADVLAKVGEAQFGKFQRRSTFCGIARKSCRGGYKNL